MCSSSGCPVPTSRPPCQGGGDRQARREQALRPTAEKVAGCPEIVLRKHQPPQDRRRPGRQKRQGRDQLPQGRSRERKSGGEGKDGQVRGENGSCRENKK